MNDPKERVDVDSIDWKNVLPYYVQDPTMLKGEWGPCPFCTGTTTFRIVWERRKEGGSGWYCAKCETGGNLVSVIHEVTGKPFGEIYYELKHKRYNQGMAPSTFVPKVKVAARPEKTPEELRTILRNTWERSLAITEDSPVWKYLSHRVPGLRIEWLGPDVRHHPGMNYRTHDGKDKGRFPVFLQRLVAAGDKTARTLQRCYLTPEGEKVPFVDAKGKSAAKKQMSSPDGPAGGSTRLNNATSRTLALTEGAETGLAVVAKFENKIEVRSMVDCGNLGRADIDWTKYDAIFIYADRDREQEKRATKGQDADEDGVVKIRPGEYHAGQLAEKLRELGKRVTVIASVQEGVDFCDIWKLQHERRTKRLAERAARQEEKERLRQQTKTFRRAA
jgi:putative DNA primase/helicase